MGPATQVLLGALALLGTPLSILAVFGSIFRMETHVRTYFQYLIVSTTVDAFWLLRILVSGGLCAAVASDFIISRGSTFVCFAITVASVFWTTVYFILKTYLTASVGIQAHSLAKGESVGLIPYGVA